MGQATADLPDPLATSPAGPTSTDDLLAQLAGEEIERLLAETEITPEPQPPASIAPQASAPQAPAPVSPPPAPVAAAMPDAALTGSHKDDLESIFTQLDERDKAAASAAPKAIAAIEAKPAAAEEPSVAEALAAEMAEDEAQHARPSGGSAASMSMDVHGDGDSASSQSGSASPSLFVSLLAVISSPLDAFSDQTRDLIGKVAILTMLNALCVLAYVIFFRR